jgi:predicted double-glycine peptidase
MPDLPEWSDIMKLVKAAGSVLLLVAGLAAGFVLGRVTASQAPSSPQAAREVAAERPGPAGLTPALLPGIPDVRQSTGYSCGAAALQAVLARWGVAEREDRLMKRLHSTPEQGTHPDDIVRGAREFGLKAELHEGLELSDLEAALGRGLSVIVDLQAWREKEDRPWTELWDDGHYMVLLGMDEKNLYFEDPSLLGSRGFIPRREFLDRWHDYEGDPPLDSTDRMYVHMAIFIEGGPPTPAPAFEPVK